MTEHASHRSRREADLAEKLKRCEQERDEWKAQAGRAVEAGLVLKRQLAELRATLDAAQKRVYELARTVEHLSRNAPVSAPEGSGAFGDMPRVNSVALGTCTRCGHALSVGYRIVAGGAAVCAECGRGEDEP